MNFFEENKNKIFKVISKINFYELKKFKSIIHKINKNNKIILIGNGGSSAICSHVATDFSKNAGIKAISFNDSSLITCLANDYGHENWMKEALKIYAEKGDVIILISSSGESQNIINAAKWTLKNKYKLITLTGFRSKNKLTKINSVGLNFWIDSNAYNHVELSHLYILLSIVDSIIGKFEYKFN
jgi:D-sedoheptulose 7-phosphate isomerase